MAMSKRSCRSTWSSAVSADEAALYAPANDESEFAKLGGQAARRPG